MYAKRESKNVAKIALALSVVVFVACVAVAVLFPRIYSFFLKKQIVLSKDSMLTSMWLNIPLPIYQRLYFFNITNGDKFPEEDEKMNVTQLGPYTYLCRFSKQDVEWQDNYTVSYREVRTQYFVPEMSNGTEDDIVHTLNGPLIVAGEYLKSASGLARYFLTLALQVIDSVVIKRSIRQLTYEGYYDAIIDAATHVKPDIPFKKGMFSWLHGQNNTDDGVFSVFTGEDDIQKINLMHSWNNQTQLNFWKNDSCNMINGTTAEAGPPLEPSQEYYTFFQSIFCRSMSFKYTKDVIHFGINAKRFQATFDNFANPSDNPDNHCFETLPGLASGVQDLHTCQFDTPLLLSFPHFVLANESYFEQINGLNPDPEEHIPYIDIDPNTGMTLGAKFRFQVNVKTSNIPDAFIFDHVPDGVFPVFWVELEMLLTKELANMFKRSVILPRTLSYSTLGIFIGASFAVIVWSIVTLFRRNNYDLENLIKSRTTSELKDRSSSIIFHKTKRTTSCSNCEQIDLNERAYVARDNPSLDINNHINNVLQSDT